MAASRKRSTVPGKKGAPSGTVAARGAVPARKGPPPRADSKLWVLPVGMLLVLAGVCVFLVAHARYLASLKFDMVRLAPIIPQGHDRGQVTGLSGMVGDAQGHLFTLETQNRPDGVPRLQRFNADNAPDSLVYKPAGPGQDLMGAVDLDCDRQGTVYVLLSDGRVQVLDSSLQWLRTLDTGIRGASAVSVNSAGRIFVADAPQNKIVYFDPDGARAGEFGTPAKGGVALVDPVLMRVTPNDEVLVVESTVTGLRGRIFTKDLTLRKTFLIDKIKGSLWVRLGVNSEDKAFFNDTSGAMGVVCWNLANGRYFGSSQSTKDGVGFVNPGCIGADRFTPAVYVHTVPGLITCRLPQPDDARSHG